MDDAMMTALIQDRLEFVKLFLENGIDLSQFLDVRNLWNLYSNVRIVLSLGVLSVCFYL